ncbi:MAG: phosphate acyltransferase PlsX [Kiritimatiellae bacterium]|nr:phosphate acyltransferase PlsX [Kiritimatiellia bacterium]
MRIAVDAMGGDHAPREIVRGAVEASREWPELEIVLLGDEAAVRRELAANKAAPSERLRVVRTTQTIEMGEAPAHAVRSKRDSSIVRGMEMLRHKEADAFLSAGSTGAMVAAALLFVGRVRYLKRPAIGTMLPTVGKPYLLLDMGATVDCSPQELEQFAVMGSVYAGAVLGLEKPRVGLLSIGTEEEKGDAATKEAHVLLKKNPFVNFVGNVEGHDLFKGEMDVCVADGFVGNVVLKTIESEARAISAMMKREFTRNPLRVLGSLLIYGGVRHLKKVMDPEIYGGAPLLGVNGTVIITHGASSHKAIYHAIRVSAECVRQDVARKITDNLAELDRRRAEDPATALADISPALT